MTQLYFTNNECRITTSLADEDAPTRLVKYSECPEFREVTWDFIYDLMEEHKSRIARHYCGSCGNSCRRPDILVREQEILPLQQRLGISETEFRDTYLLPSPTWNPGDGLMRTVDGSCPLLEVLPGESGPDTARCSVYDVRPQSCRDFVSDKDFCYKDAGRMIESLSMVSVDAEQIKVVMANGDVSVFPTAPEVWERLWSAVRASEPPDPERLERMAETVGEILDELIQKFHPAKVDDLYKSNFQRLRGLVEGIATLLHLNPSVSESLEELWSSLRRLEDLMAGEYEEAADEALDLSESAVEWALVQELSIMMKLRDRLDPVVVPVTATPALHDAVRSFVKSVLQRHEDVLQLWLKQEDPPCYMCGECCRFYSVEIKPSDVLRLCELLEMRPATFVERYTEPARFSWNKKARILKKTPAPRYSKNLKSLRILGTEEEMETKQCVFLERREDGFFYCSVHSHKPQVCRDYTASNALCRATNQLDNWGRQAKSIAFLQVTPTEFLVQTHNRLQEERPPLNFARAAWPDVESAFRSLESAVMDGLAVTVT